MQRPPLGVGHAPTGGAGAGAGAGAVASPAAPPVSPQEQSLSLKVMRLYKPLMGEARPGLGVHGLDARTWTQAGTGALLLPDGFGKIYIGQVFACYISVCNNGSFAEVRNLAIKVELEAGGARRALLDKRESDPSATPDSSRFGKLHMAKPHDAVDMVVERELVGIGMHTLRVIVEFDCAQVPGTLRSIRKHYKFNVAKPISFGCRFTRLPPRSAAEAARAPRLLAQVTVKNLTQGDLLLPHVEMHPLHDGLLAKPLQTDKLLAPSPESGPALAPAAFSVRAPPLVQPGATLNFLFVLEPKSSASPEALELLLRPGAPVARILTRWRTDFAEQGRLMSQPLVWAAERAADSVHVEVVHPAEPLQVGCGSAVACTVTNGTDHPIDARLVVEAAPGAPLVLTGTTLRALGVIPGHQSRTATLTAMPLRRGLHDVRGLSVVDVQTGRHFLPNGGAAALFCA